LAFDSRFYDLSKAGPRLAYIFGLIYQFFIHIKIKNNYWLNSQSLTRLTYSVNLRANDWLAHP